MNRLTVTAALALALIFMGLNARSASAGLVHQTPQPAPTAESYKDWSAVGLHVELVAGEPWSAADFSILSYYEASSWGKYWDCYTKFQNMATASIVGPLAAGTPVDGAAAWSAADVTLASYYRWLPDPASIDGPFGGATDMPGYLGVRLNDGGQVHYGWMRVETTGGARQKMTIHEWAVNLVPGEAIEVGQTTVPEPATLAMLAPAGLMLIRRRGRSGARR